MLNTENEVASCGQQMGEAFAKRLREVVGLAEVREAPPGLAMQLVGG